MEIFCNIINVFTVTFDQFNACLLNKIISLKFFTNAKIWNCIASIIFFFFTLLSSILYNSDNIKEQNSGPSSSFPSTTTSAKRTK